jgi:hypothetical protein
MKSDLLIGCDQIQTINQERQFFEVQGHPRREGLPGTERTVAASIAFLYGRRFRNVFGQAALRWYGL